MSAFQDKLTLWREVARKYRGTEAGHAFAGLIPAVEDGQKAFAALRDLVAEHDDTYDGEPMTGEKALALEAARAALRRASLSEAR